MGCRRIVPAALATLLVAAVALLAAAACTMATPTPTTVATATPTLIPTPIAISKLEPSAPGQATVVVKLGQASFFALVADTPELRALGLSGRDHLPRDWGMWFDLGGVGSAGFWMLGMRFPLDIVWVNDALRVVHVTHDAPAPSPGAVAASLPVYTAEPVPIRYVLEIGAGLARELGIGPGIAVTVKPAPLE